MRRTYKLYIDAYIIHVKRQQCLRKTVDVMNNKQQDATVRRYRSVDVRSNENYHHQNTRIPKSLGRWKDPNTHPISHHGIWDSQLSRILTYLQGYQDIRARPRQAEALVWRGLAWNGRGARLAPAGLMTGWTQPAEPQHRWIYPRLCRRDLKER